ncbi:oxidoreductase domain protein [Nannochloropsis gaditana CCMP526]|uniref:Oxidoreductase domain protein n=2 Tax=Nannochloropsis gaditana TaxID=72520 RepID=W7TC13_9STRA|nr:oxidoreductase domain protein [Nannochloropsis gaditana CCMP526]EKU20137.1 oxidoreductase domain protein [Nannochloropsis gaditana CCMP526]EWM21108.1 oxidoreductase domain protein [Nannochloropsis gaditana]|eukprot:XP_005856220.1 oxidoreductase domain protein [Nannochloropsis gaditana CCMP526]
MSMTSSFSITPTSDILNWGVIGCGDVVEGKSGPAFSRIPSCRLVAVMRRNKALAESFAHRHNVASFYTDAREILRDLDVEAIYLATPPGTHKDLALLCAAAGKPVLVEKPMARSAAECRAMLSEFQHSDLPLFVAYYRRHLPKFELVRDILQSKNKLGPITEIRAFCARPSSGSDCEEWRVDASVAGGGLFLDLGSHMLDLLDWWFGPLQDVKGLAASTKGKGSSYDSALDEVETHVEDQVRMLFRTGSGAVGVGSWNFSSHCSEDYIEIIGADGGVKFSVFDNGPVFLKRRGCGEEDEIEVIDNFGPDFSPHVHLPLIAAVTEDLQDWKRAREVARQGRSVMKEISEWRCRSTGASALRTSEVMDTVLAAYYGGSRDDAFWERPQSWSKS